MMSILTDKINNAIKEFYSFIDTTCTHIFLTLTWLFITVLAPLLATQVQGCPPPMFSSYDTFFSFLFDNGQAQKEFLNCNSG